MNEMTLDGVYLFIYKVHLSLSINLDSPEFKMDTLRNLIKLESEIHFRTDGRILNKTKIKVFKRD